MPITYTVPNFNLTCDVWAAGTPLVNPPDWSGNCQLYVNSRFGSELNTAIFGSTVALVIRIPIDILGFIGIPMVGGYIAINEPTLGVKYYLITAWEVCHSGFPNQYVMFHCVQADGAGLVPDNTR